MGLSIIIPRDISVEAITMSITRNGKNSKKPIWNAVFSSDVMKAGRRTFNGTSSAEDVPLNVLLPAFITSELKTAFQIGFLLFLPFLVIDMVIASTLMSLGMMMLSPMLVSLPFKLLLFVLVDGWAMTVGSLVATYQVT